MAELHTPVLRIEEGAFFQGSCDMGAEPASKVVDLQAQRK
jgi:cytoskeletal protein CcmA (bactofilin family)